MPFRPSPRQIATAWNAFRGDARGRLIGPGPGFAEAIGAALELNPDLILTDDERGAMARAMYAEACRGASCRPTYVFAGSADDMQPTLQVWFDRLEVALRALAAIRDA